MVYWEKLRNSLFYIKLARLLLVSFWIPILLSLAFVSDANATDSNISISMDPNVDLPLIYGGFSSANLNISVSTTSSQGYTITLETRGTSNDLVSSLDNYSIIPTITLPNGVDSITPSEFPHGYGYSTDGQHYKPTPSVESDGDVMWEVDHSNAGVTDSYTMTFGAKISEDIMSGDYTRTFVITAISNGVQECPTNTICYSSNASDVEGETANQSVTSNTTVTLSAPNYIRAGYGFVGWTTSANGAETIYGPNQSVAIGDLSESGMTLYAKWVASSGNLQDWTGCATMSIGDVTALTDSRDNNTYAVVKQPDGQCWMMENLRLDFSNPNVTISTANTNNPNGTFVNSANAHPSSTNSFCSDNTVACLDSFRYNSDNVTSGEHYSYGVYYNWYTATAGNGKRETSTAGQKAEGDICPKGWHLPTGYGDSGNLAKLNAAINAGLSASVAAKNWRAYPNNFMLSGQYKPSGVTDQGGSGNYLSSTVSSSTSVNNLWIQPTQVKHTSNGSSKANGQNVRCMIDNNYTIKFDKNNSNTVSGEMSDQEAVYGIATHLNTNNFSIGLIDHTGYFFKEWNTKADGTGTSYADGAEVTSLTEVGQTITLYAQWEAITYVDVEVNFQEDEVTKVDFRNSTYGNQSVTTDGGTAIIAIGKPYQISLELDSEYDFDSWETSANGTLASTVGSVTTYTVSGSATLTANAKRRDGRLYLQRVTLASCPTTAVSAIDSRDNKTYTIQRLSDGKCWMLDNLRLDPSDLISELSSSNTNMPENSNFTLPESGFASSYALPKIDAANKDTVHTVFANGSGKIGVYYNYCAASAGTVCTNSSTAKATHDICPAGWRLPNGTKNTGEYKALYTAYGSSPANLKAAFAAPLAGYFDAATNAVRDYGNNTYIWSNAAYNNNKSYSLSIVKNTVNPEFGGLRTNGFPVRCVLD